MNKAAAALIAFLSWSPAIAAGPRQTVSLDGDAWTLTPCAFGNGEKLGLQHGPPRNLKSLPVSVPNDVQISGFVKDALGQSSDVVDVNGKEWWYTRQFRSPQVSPGRQVRIIFDGVDYFADVWLNDVKLGSHEGAYTRFEFDVTGRLSRSGVNYIAVRVTAPWKVEGRSHYEFMKGEFEETWDALPGPGQVVFPLGLHRSVRLETTGSSRIGNIAVWTASLQNETAHLQSTIQIDNRGGPGDGIVQVTITPENFSGTPLTSEPRNVSFRNGHGESVKLDFELEVKDPRLWWTWDLGAQNLYRAEATLVDRAGRPVDSSSTVFGIRTLERDQNLLYRINGKPLFMRGAWYPMSKLYPASTDRWTYEKDLRLARNANMNHLVNYTVIEKDDFYDLADRLGILLFIELPFNQEGPIDALNAAYPRRDLFIKWSSGEVRQLIQQLNNHPSIGVWSAVSEVTGNGHDFQVSWDPRVAQAADGYSLFVKAMEQVVEEEDRDALYFRSYCDFGEHHFWEGTFFNGTTYDQQFDASAPFISEYGALAFFPLEDAARVVDPEKLWKSGDAHWSSFRLPIGLKKFSYVQPWQYAGLDFFTADISAYVTREIKSFREYVNASQVYQDFIYGYAGDAYRRKLFAPVNGVRSWMLKSFPEIPVGGFGVIDAFDQAVPAYYTQKRTFASLVMSFAIRNPLESLPGGSQLNVPVWLSNATGQALKDAAIGYTLYDLEGNQLQSGTATATVKAYQAEHVAQIAWQLPALGGIYLLRGSAQQRGRVIAVASTFIKVATPPTRKQLRVLVTGSPEWAGPVAEFLTGLGAAVTSAIAENTVIRPIVFPASAVELKRDFDVIWLTGYDNYWREAPERITGTIREAVRAGVTFVHTGSPASFHGGGERTAGLDLTALAELMPVTLEHENDIYLKSSYRAGSQPNEFASQEARRLSVNATAPRWMRQIPFANLSPDSFHLLGAKKEANILIEMDGRPILITGRFGKGRTFAYLGFSPENSVRVEHKPLILDRAIRESPEGKLFGIVSATLLALASGESPPASIERLIDSRTKPMFESLMERPSGEGPQISATWTEDAAGQTVGHLRIENGPVFAFGLRIRLEGDDVHSGRTLALWSNQYFDLLPHEAAACNVTLLQADTSRPKPFQIVAETMAGVQNRYSMSGVREQNSK